MQGDAGFLSSTVWGGLMGIFGCLVPPPIDELVKRALRTKRAALASKKARMAKLSKLLEAWAQRSRPTPKRGFIL